MGYQFVNGNGISQRYSSVNGMQKNRMCYCVKKCQCTTRNNVEESDSFQDFSTFLLASQSNSFRVKQPFRSRSIPGQCHYAPLEHPKLGPAWPIESVLFRVLNVLNALSLGTAPKTCHPCVCPLRAVKVCDPCEHFIFESHQEFHSDFHIHISQFCKSI